MVCAVDLPLEGGVIPVTGAWMCASCLPQHFFKGLASITVSQKSATRSVLSVVDEGTRDHRTGPCRVRHTSLVPGSGMTGGSHLWSSCHATGWDAFDHRGPRSEREPIFLQLLRSGWQ